MWKVERIRDAAKRYFSLTHRLIYCERFLNISLLLFIIDWLPFRHECSVVWHFSGFFNCSHKKVSRTRKASLTSYAGWTESWAQSKVWRLAFERWVGITKLFFFVGSLKTILFYACQSDTLLFKDSILYRKTTPLIIPTVRKRLKRGILINFITRIFFFKRGTLLLYHYIQFIPRVS